MSGRDDDDMDVSASNTEDLGTLERGDGGVRVTFTRRLSSSPQNVWRALVEPEHLAAWFPTTIEGERAVGAPLHYAFRENEAAPFDGEMLAFDPPALMEFRWGDETLRFEVAPDGDGSVLVFTCAFQEIGKVSRDGAGWHSCLDLLAFEVARRAAPWSAADRWKDLHATYVDRFGPEASTIGPPEEWERVHGSVGEKPQS
jgi:uncharacterized protein YndB with AHSA1/START domain